MDGHQPLRPEHQDGCTVQALSADRVHPQSPSRSRCVAWIERVLNPVLVLMPWPMRAGKREFQIGAYGGLRPVVAADVPVLACYRGDIVETGA